MGTSVVKEPKPDDFAIIPERDEIASYRSRHGNAAATSTGNVASVAPPVKTSVKLFIFIAFIIACGAVGLALYLKLELDKANGHIASSQKRVKLLEDRLSITDEHASESAVVLKMKLKEHDSEIRKLWAISYNKNKQAIAENKENVAKNQEDLAAQEKLITTNTSGVGNNQAALEAMQRQIKSHTNKVEQHAGLLQAMDARLISLDETGTANNSTLGQLASDYKMLELRVDTIDKLATTVTNDNGGVKVKKLEEGIRRNTDAVTGINAHRKQINKELLQLKQEIQRLQGITPNPG